MIQSIEVDLKRCVSERSRSRLSLQKVESLQVDHKRRVSLNRKRKNLRAENASVKIQYTQNQCLTLLKVNEFCTVFGNLHFLIYLLDINASS